MLPSTLNRHTKQMKLHYVASNATATKSSERKWASSELAFEGFGDGSERVSGYRQMFGHVGTLGGMPQERGPPQVSRLATQPHLIAASPLDALALKVH